MFWYCLLVELVVLVMLAWWEKLPHFVANVGAGFLAFCFLAFFGSNKSIGVNLGVCGLLGFFAYLGGIILWNAVRFVCLGRRNLREAIEALDTVAMESAVARSLAGKPSTPNSYGNRRVAQEVVRALNRNDKVE
jgi:hypothetical protein